MSSASPTIAELKLQLIDRRIAAMQAIREDVLRERGAELSFKPCDDCANGFCTMNCSSAPIIMKVSFP